jgi:hypothetical protein
MFPIGPTSIRKKRKKRNKGDWFSYVIGDIFGGAVRTWVVMLLLGAAHIHISPAIPALGYWQTLLGLVLLSAVLSDAVSSGVTMALREELA